jgi:hypothetical protein
MNTPPAKSDRVALIEDVEEAPLARRHVIEDLKIGSGRHFTVDIKTCDGQSASELEFAMALAMALQCIFEPVE